MKKLYTLICASVFTAFSVSAATVNVAVGVNSSGAAANEFTPAAVAAVVGDVITFTHVSTSGVPHNVTSTAVPGGAAAMNSGTMSFGQQYMYTVTVAGTYAYTCTFHAGMNGTVNVTTVGIVEPNVDFSTNAYPNPFKDKITVKFNGVESLEVFNIVGDKVRTIELTGTDNKMEIDFSALPSGVYFYRTYKEGNIVETKRIVKTK
ncbi:MAG: T9SS type A sorting domain-containing protein [Bacteroidota bacterium]|nr:T9SS type A sorting domain-containing protein [Bacteroidota bacterium]